MSNRFDPHKPFIFELEYWETEEYRALERLRLKASAMLRDYTAEIVTHRMAETVAKAGEVQLLLEEARDAEFDEEVILPIPPAGFGSITAIDSLVAAVYALVSEPDGHIPATIRELRAYLDDVRRKVEWFQVSILAEQPSDPHLLLERQSIHHNLKHLEGGMRCMEVMAKQVELLRTFFKDMVYR
ncbi:hypothetical protein A1Q1_03027 [Trichosporon asahii var. asahii CBS 2479]|uniref:Uncharacterized protein n=1 Tax=Trichosporon asahii var. asahii (strain ATCC 90039 / CBS 2479 / JCM 2466 / KCTC 7840 / NBRC 103889/ NCYC 2677 / UAMH 7654) TaxID=1186058 RepID=J6ETW9_TRIAS|nr:hypothetical protein A1Q1_03027 [Trichosporon asahii var. asahii CBS 2479]EJT47989.1 hypothetical protein A1Q1_03027 [Trichosporon asahii var. asahii CBS 2479]